MMQSADTARARLERVVAELLSGADHSGNIVIPRTPPGAAQYLASRSITRRCPKFSAPLRATTQSFVVSRDPKGGSKVANQFAMMATRRGSVATSSHPNPTNTKSVAVEEKL